MKIGLLNPWGGPAEEQCVLHTTRAALSLGHVAIECKNTQDILKHEPDLVLSLAAIAPKLTHVPTYGLLHEWRDFWLRDPRFLSNLYTYDGLFTVSETLREFASHLLFAARRDTEIGYFYPTCVGPEWEAMPSLSSARLAYFGSNWDNRRTTLFQLLGDEPWLEIYGPERGWEFLRGRAYRGSVPLDGVSVLERYHAAGAGLCILSDNHLADDSISNRVFEISAAGAVTIGPRMPWLLQNFGDSILYVDQEAPDPVLARQIQEQVTWIHRHPEEARAKADRAHRIFKDRFSLDVLLRHVVDYHERRRSASSPPAGPVPLISVIVQCDGGSTPALRRAIQSVVAQAHQRLELIVTMHRDGDPEPALAPVRARFEATSTVSSAGSARSKGLVAALAACSGDYVAVLGDHDEWMPRHLSSLLSTIVASGHGALACSGTIRHHAQPFATETGTQDVRSIQSFPLGPIPRDPFAALDQCPLHSLLFARTLLDRWILEDPGMETAEDAYVALSLLEKAAPRFTYRATVVRHEAEVPSTVRSDRERFEDAAKLRLRFLGRTIAASGTSVGLDAIRTLELTPNARKRTSAGLVEYLIPFSFANAFDPEERWERVPFKFGRHDIHPSHDSYVANDVSFFPIVVEPPRVAWGWGLQLEVRCPDERPHVVRLHCRVVEGWAGFGVLTKGGDDFVYRLFVPSQRERLIVNLPIPRPAEAGNVLVQAGNEAEPVKIVVESVELLVGRPSDPASPSGATSRGGPSAGHLIKRLRLGSRLRRALRAAMDRD